MSDPITLEGDELGSGLVPSKSVARMSRVVNDLRLHRNSTLSPLPSPSRRDGCRLTIAATEPPSLRAAQAGVRHISEEAL